MTPSQERKREKIVKAMKKNFSDFRQRYGSDAKSVMYATATKQAMDENSEENRKDIDEINSKYLRGLTFHFVKEMIEVLDIAILSRKVLNPKKFKI